ncbi:hypothetical protein L6R50_15345 [Myxococcota bacterium]|nr:hypothetical protein [Myxococcota bacterium]
MSWSAFPARALAALAAASLLAPGLATAADPAPAAGGGEVQDGPFARWDPEVYAWGKDGAVQGLVGGGVFLGLLIAGTAIQHDLAADNAVAYGFPYHIPPGGPGEHPPGEVVPGYVGEYLFLAGVQGTLPSFGSTIPTVIAASTGADLRTVKTVGSFAASASMFATGIFQLNRFAIELKPQVDIFSAPGSGGARIYFVPAAVATLASGIADMAVATVFMVNGALLAAGAKDATGAPGLLAEAPPLPWFTPTPGGAAFGLDGRF